jgi:hypothetical protein
VTVETDFVAAARAFDRLALELTKDHEAWAEQMSPRNQILRRAYIRAAFAFVEGAVFGAKAFLLKVHGLGEATLSPGELALLREEGYSLNRQGQVQARALFLSTAENVRFTLGILYRVYRRVPHPAFGSAGWSAFRKSLAIRNRITHPKRVADYRVSAADLETVRFALRWFGDQMARGSYGTLDGVRGSVRRKELIALLKQGRRRRTSGCS